VRRKDLLKVFLVNRDLYTGKFSLRTWLRAVKDQVVNIDTDSAFGELVISGLYENLGKNGDHMVIEDQYCLSKAGRTFLNLYEARHLIGGDTSNNPQNNVS